MQPCWLNVILLLWIVNLYVTIEVSACIDEGPDNAAVKTGERVKFTCKAKPDSRLRWSTKIVGRNDELILTRAGGILPNFERNYSLEASNGEFNLIIANTSSHNAGRYICLDLSSSKTASAELIVIESTPICNSTKNATSTILRCDVKYKGNWHPDIALSIRHIREPEVQVLPDQLTTELIVPRLVDCEDLYYACTVKFSKNGTSSKTFSGERVNEVVGTVAKNTPEYSTTINCPPSPFINCGILQHLTSNLLVVACAVVGRLL